MCSQSFADWEWIVVDGASNDGTVEWLQTIDDPRVKWESEKDQGIYDALNKGIERSNGKVLGFLHADDFFANDQVLESIHDRLTQSDIDGIYGDLKYVSAETGRTVRHWKSEVFTSSLLRKGWMPPHPTCFFKKEVYTHVGLFDTSFRIAADYDFLLRCLLNDRFQFAYMPQVITHMRIGGASSKWQNLVKKSREDIRALRKNGIPFPLMVVFRKVSSKLGQFF